MSEPNRARSAPPAGTGPPIVEIDGLVKRYGDVTAIDGVSFSLPAGTVTGLLGPNGAGKSTTLRILLGLTRPTAGGARVFGRPFTELGEAMTKVGAVFEGNDVHPGRTGRNHLRVLAELASVGRQRIATVLDLVELGAAADAPARTYSFGMCRRLGLAAALLGEPELLVLDEPANGLDPAGIRWLRSVVRGHATSGGTVLMSSHQLGEVARTVDNVVIIDRGRVLADAPIADVTAGGVSLEESYLALTGEAGR